MSRYIDLDQIEFLKVDGNKEFNHGVDCCINRLLEAEPIKAIPIPEGATNVDMLKAVFPNIKITYSKYDVEGTPHIIMAHGMDGVTSFTADWANAPYVGSEEE